jgi:hypothetical protein
MLSRGGAIEIYNFLILKLAVISQNIWSPSPQNTRRYWGRAKAESFSHFSLPKNPTIRLLDVGFLWVEP